jgi:hypothetical protein
MHYPFAIGSAARKLKELPGRLFLITLLFASPLCQLVSAETPPPPASGAGTGIEGIVSISPIHGGPSRQGVPDSAPLANTSFLVENTAGAVVTFETDDHGRFRVSLPPGHYTVRLKDLKVKHGCGPFAVDVSTDGFKKLQWDCDSGLR